MDCREFANLIDRIIDNKITAQEEVIFKEHISNCPTCCEEYADILKINQALEEMGKQELPSNFTAQVVNRAKREGLILTKPQKITVFSKIAMAVASFLFLFLLLDYTVLPHYTDEGNVRIKDFQIQQETEGNMERVRLGMGRTDDRRGLRNAIVLASAILLSSPFVIETYKRKATY